MKTVRDFLQIITVKIPPESGQHHGVTLCDDGTDLILTLMVAGKWYSLRLDEADLNLDASCLADKVLDFWALICCA